MAYSKGRIGNHYYNFEVSGNVGGSSLDVMLPNGQGFRFYGYGDVSNGASLPMPNGQVLHLGAVQR